MESVCMCVELHLPYHLKWYWPADGYRRPEISSYFDQERIFTDFQHMAASISRTNKVLTRSIENGAAYTLNLSGTFLDQCSWDPRVLNSFRDLADTGNVAFAASTYYHSLSALYPDLTDFKEQVWTHMEKISELFGVVPSTFVNPELLTSGNIGGVLKKLGLTCMIAEGARNLLNTDMPVSVFSDDIPTLLRHIDLSEDISKRFSDKSWDDHPLTADKFASWIEHIEGDVITLYLDYGSIPWNESKAGGMFQFLKDLPLSLEERGISMIRPEDAIKRFEKVKLDTLKTESAARYGMEGLLGNHAQHFYLKQLEIIVQELAARTDLSENGEMKKIFGYLQQSDIFLDMNTANITGYEKAVNNLSILSDFRRAIWEGRT
ncbi:glycoside hydrolase family 57 protein [Methanomethylovorans sp.]|uniref:glycoside hydrolase family 57 protein n=1 Tax=Methanomethylovorans sp. TaxID=2758717 RepID=UPI002FDDD0D5